jgi:hypothetical protein
MGMDDGLGDLADLSDLSGLRLDRMFVAGCNLAGSFARKHSILASLSHQIIPVRCGGLIERVFDHDFPKCK